MYHPQLQSVELPRPLLQLLSPKKKIFDFPRQAGCQQVGNRHQNFPIFDKSISYLSHLKMKPRIKETKIWTLEKGLLCANFLSFSYRFSNDAWWYSLYISESFDENDEKGFKFDSNNVYVWPWSLGNCLDQFLTGAETQTNASGCTTTTTTTIAMHGNH